MEEDCFCDLIDNLYESQKFTESVLATIRDLTDCKDIKLFELLLEELTRIETNIHRLNTYQTNNIENNPERVNHSEEKNSHVPVRARTAYLFCKQHHPVPVRARTSYFFFCKQQRPVINEENPTLSVREQTRELGRRWRELRYDDREPYNEQAEKDKKRYEEDKKRYEEELKDAIKRYLMWNSRSNIIKFRQTKRTANGLGK